MQGFFILIKTAIMQIFTYTQMFHYHQSEAAFTDDATATKRFFIRTILYKNEAQIGPNF